MIHPSCDIAQRRQGNLEGAALAIVVPQQQDALCYGKLNAAVGTPSRKGVLTAHSKVAASLLFLLPLFARTRAQEDVAQFHGGCRISVGRSIASLLLHDDTLSLRYRFAVSYSHPLLDPPPTGCASNVCTSCFVAGSPFIRSATPLLPGTGLPFQTTVDCGTYRVGINPARLRES